MFKKLIFFIITLFPLLVLANPTNTFKPDTTYFRMIPILHEGRMKPLETFAKIELERISGRSKYNNQDPINWLIEVIFNPGEMVTEKIFYIHDHQIKYILELDDKSKYFSFIELSNSLKKHDNNIQQLLITDTAKLSKSQKDLIDIYIKNKDFSDLLRSISLFLPLKVQLPSNMKHHLKSGHLSYYNSYKFMESITARTTEIAKKNNIDNFDKLSKLDQEYVKFSYEMQIIDNGSEGNNLFKIIPSPYTNNADEWFGPWTIINEGLGSPISLVYMGFWQNMVDAYYHQDVAKWNEITKNAYEYITHNKIKHLSSLKLKLEVLYYKIDFIQKTIYLYLLALISIIGLYYFKQDKKLQIISYITIMFAILIHAFSIFSRMIILERPPVGTLYESIIFIPLVISIISVTLEYFKKNNLGIIIASICGSSLLILSRYYTIGEDNIALLIAVLNTNFWLATHVICVTTGYAVSIISGTLAHIYLFRRDSNDALFASIHFIVIIALFFTAFGTILGGIWADQSWGRFWGWDPKENGALLIVLWIIWLLHGKLSGHLKKLSFIVGVAFLNVVVTLSWFGVNLLSVGLHSYGFTDKAAYAFFAFCIIETVLIAMLWKLSNSNLSRSIIK